MMVRSPTDPDLYLGTVVRVDSQRVLVNLPFAAAASLRRVEGRRTLGGLVGDYVTVEADGWTLLGRLDATGLPERDRHLVDPQARGAGKDPHPIGTVALLATVDLRTSKVEAGVAQYPVLGARVYLAPEELVHTALSGAASVPTGLAVGSPRHTKAPIHIDPAVILDRHCAIIGATGGGKSWTLAQLVEQVSQRGGRVLLIDATGEYHTLGVGARHVALGSAVDRPAGCIPIQFPYWLMEDADLFALFTPSGQSQGPILREAIRSLRLVAAVQQSGDAGHGLSISEDGTLIKERQSRVAYLNALREHRAAIERARGSYFDIGGLVRQLQHECVWPSGGSASSPDPTVWGGRDERAISYIVTLITRVESFIQDNNFACVFDATGSAQSFESCLDEFTESADGIMRLSLRHLPAERNFRQLTVNAVIRYLVDLARQGKFKSNPLVVAVDECHHFLGDVLHLEEMGVRLEALEIAAKEGRKYGLHMILATQRPRDLTPGVLSQIGCLIAHRMTDDRDLAMLEHVASGVEGGAARFVPSLTAGHALLTAIGLPFPLVLRMRGPRQKPDSAGTDFTTAWTTRP